MSRVMGNSAGAGIDRTGKRVALLFPGQGSQHIGMGKSLYELSSAARAVFEEASDTLSMDVQKLCFTGPLRQLARVDNMQLALLTVSRAAFAVYMEQFGMQPDFAAGHSLGEYSALVCSGALAFSDALQVVKLRGELSLRLSEQEAGYMMVVQNAGAEQLLKLCTECSSGEDVVVPACFNSPVQTVVAGTPEALSRLEAELWKMEITTTTASEQCAVSFADYGGGGADSRSGAGAAKCSTVPVSGAFRCDSAAVCLRARHRKRAWRSACSADSMAQHAGLR